MKIITWVFGEKCTVCNKTHTNRKDSNGNRVCYDCQIEQKIAAEKRLKCPKCSHMMEKEFIEKTVIDKCPHCGGVFLDDKEMFGFLHAALIPHGG